MRKILAVTSVALAVSSSFAFAAEEEIKGTSYLEDVIDEERVISQGEYDANYAGLTEEEILAIESDKQKQIAADAAGGKYDVIEGRAFSNSVFKKYPIEISGGLEWRQFDHSNEYRIQYPVEGSTRVTNQHTSNMSNLWLTGKYVYQEHTFGVELTTSFDSSVDYDNSNARGNNDPDYTKFGFTYAYQFHPKFRAGGKLEFGGLDVDYIYIDRSKTYTDEVSQTNFKGFVGYADSRDNIRWGADAGIMASNYEYTSAVTPGLTPGYNANIDSTGFGVFADVNVGVAITDQLVIEGRAGVSSTSLGSPSMSADYDTRDVSMDTSEGYVGLGVSFGFEP